VDSGDLFFPPGSTPQSLAGKEREIFDPKIDLYIKAYNEMKYDGFTPGDTDLSLGVQELLKRSRQAQFPFLLANLMDRQSKKPVFVSYVIKKAEGMKASLASYPTTSICASQQETGRNIFWPNPKKLQAKSFLN
jgi:2',3'-cyclic-nucleotide 2'-phosphodiesterase (5'-nucleotidase family)